MTACLVLVDGEHYPPVVAATVDKLEASGHRVLAALFLGGTEKTATLPELGVPVFAGDPIELLPRLIDEYRATEIVDLSDEPVLDYRQRMALAGQALMAGVKYVGGDFSFEPPPFPRLTSLPTVAVIGTGKRTGKTAVSIDLARYWRDEGRRVCIVTMGRGGPPDPVVARSDDFNRSAEGLLALAAEGLHAASDYIEDAVFAGVDTVGTRRTGAGLAGATMDDNFHLGVSVGEGLHPDLMIYEGSGTAVPPAAADATVLVMQGDLDPEYLRGYFGPFRLALADAVVILEGTLGEEGTKRLAGIAESVRPGLPVYPARYQPEPTIDVDGQAVLVATTAPREAGSAIGAGVIAAGAAAVEVVHTLADRKRLADDLGLAKAPAVVLTEVKAAAVDIVVPWAREREIEVGFLHNRVVIGQGMDSLARVVEGRW